MEMAQLGRQQAVFSSCPGKQSPPFTPVIFQNLLINPSGMSPDGVKGCEVSKNEALEKSLLHPCT